MLFIAPYTDVDISVIADLAIKCHSADVSPLRTCYRVIFNRKDLVMAVIVVIKLYSLELLLFYTMHRLTFFFFFLKIL